MTHVGYVAAAYCLTFAVIGGLIAWVVADGTLQRRKLRVLEAEGVGRRSDRQGATDAAARTGEPGP